MKTPKLQGNRSLATTYPCYVVLTPITHLSPRSPSTTPARSIKTRVVHVHAYRLACHALIHFRAFSSSSGLAPSARTLETRIARAVSKRVTPRGSHSGPTLRRVGHLRPPPALRRRRTERPCAPVRAWRASRGRGQHGTLREDATGATSELNGKPRGCATWSVWASGWASMRDRDRHLEHCDGRIWRGTFRSYIKDARCRQQSLSHYRTH